jgi:hypothetical protein
MVPVQSGRAGGCDPHHTGAEAGRHPAPPGSRCESGLAGQFTAIVTGCGIYCVATPRKIAAGVDSPSGRRGYGDHKRGAHPVAAAIASGCSACISKDRSPATGEARSALTRHVRLAGPKKPSSAASSGTPGTYAAAERPIRPARSHTDPPSPGHS